MLKSSLVDLGWSDFRIHLLGSLLAGSVLYVVSLAIYRLTFHPLSEFPGPWLARASYGYEFWYDVVRGARYTQQLARLHSRYGPIIRINPDELHCNDPSFVDTVYAVGNRKRNKPIHHIMGWSGDSPSAFLTADHDHHRIRRSAISKFLSRARVNKIESLIQKNAQVLCDNFLALRGRAAFDVTSAYNCFSADTDAEYCFGSSRGLLEQAGWEPNCKSSIEAVESLTHIRRHAPWARYIWEWAPLFLVKMASSGLYTFLVTTKVKNLERIDRVKAALEADQVESCPVLLELMNSDLPEEEKTMKRLSYECNGLTLAGAATTSSTLSTMTYYLLSHPTAYDRLRKELLANVSDARNLPHWAELEELPYLTAVIHESLRMLYDATRERLPYDTSQERLPRIATEEDLVYKPSCGDTEHVVPRGWAVGMSACVMHLNEDMFPEASKFIPERWLDESGQRNKRQERHMLAFSRGSRSCPGIYLAYCELYMVTAAVALRVLPYLELCDAAHSIAAQKTETASSQLKRSMVRVRNE